MEEKLYKIQRFTFALFVLLISLFTPISEVNAELYPVSEIKKDTPKALVVGIFPRRNRSVTEEIFSSLIQYVQDKLDRPLILKVPSSFHEFWKGVQQDKFDLVHYNQYHYIVSHKTIGHQVILRNYEFGGDTISAAIVVREDSGINSIADLKGKEILFGGGPRAMQSYIFARYLLENKNLVVGDYERNFVVNPPNAIYAVYYGKADAAGIGDKVLQLDMVKNHIDMNKIRVLVRGKQLPQLPWAVKGDMDPQLKTKIIQILSTMQHTPAGLKALNKAKLEKLVVTEDSDYNQHRKIVRSVLGETY